MEFNLEDFSETTKLNSADYSTFLMKQWLIFRLPPNKNLPDTENWKIANLNAAKFTRYTVERLCIVIYHPC